MTIEARESYGSIEIHGAATLSEALIRANAEIRKFVEVRTFTIWQTTATPLLTNDGGVMCWTVEVGWRVTS